ncbi:hypothetical protein PPACK8108_LOCUS23614 [Phakopsora pachyrhizi]|uniref:Uncharacterized protein n=1 Tax=Phakopsora pachyrhizi TaxID=170000 RepID=A0AAV0BPL7_PHAPC|nr:hypothetical protein PPACK8108_LOCUS23614 [Phakopsora pachyrhizi]
MTPLENNTHLSGAPFPHPTVSLLCPISSPTTFLNTNTGCITEQNETEQDDNSNDNIEHNENEDEDEEEEEEQEDEDEDEDKDEDKDNDANENRGAILPMEGCKANDNTIKDPASGTFKNLDDLIDKIVHVLKAINMVQAHAKCQDNPAGPSSFICSKGKGKASISSIETISSKALQLVYKEIGLERPLYCVLMEFCAPGVRGLMLGSNNWRKCGALESLQIITLSNEILKLKGNDFEEPYWPRTSKYILQIIKSCFLPADPKSHKPMCPSRYEIAKCIVSNFGDTWHSKVDDSRKQHLSLPKKALVNAVISELS